jgi:DMSO/TMAO reductase YedYZ molybdopterin-dependent catalytic subunit
VQAPVEQGTTYSGRGFLGAVALSGLGLAWATQNGPLSRGEWGPFFIARVPKGVDKAQRFPIETLFRVQPIPVEQYRLELAGGVERPGLYTLADLAKLPVHTREIRTSCVSGWSSVNTWSGYLVRDVLALAEPQPGTKQLRFQSVTNYGVSWPAHRVLGDDALLATMVNGEPLIVEHGAPLRLIVPGYPGQNMVKQVVYIRADTDPIRFAPDLKLTEALPTDGHCAPRPAGETA